MNSQNRWLGWALRKKEVTATTWKLRAVVIILAVVILSIVRTPCLTAIGNSLVHEQSLQPAELLVLDNFDTSYEVFQTAARLMGAGYAPRLVVPVRTVKEDPSVEEVESGFVEVLSRVSGLKTYELLPVKHHEPISLNVANEVADFLLRQEIRSVIVVSPRLRSARSCLVYEKVFSTFGIAVQCQAAEASESENWWETWHGVQDVGLQVAKLLYYRFWVFQVRDIAQPEGPTPTSTQPTRSAR